MTIIIKIDILLDFFVFRKYNFIIHCALNNLIKITRKFIYMIRTRPRPRPRPRLRLRPMEFQLGTGKKKINTKDTTLKTLKERIIINV